MEISNGVWRAFVSSKSLLKCGIEKVFSGVGLWSFSDDGFDFSDFFFNFHV